MNYVVIPTEARCSFAPTWDLSWFSAGFAAAALGLARRSSNWHVLVGCKARFTLSSAPKTAANQFLKNFNQACGPTSPAYAQTKILVHAIAGISDHLHLLIQLPPTVTLAKAVLTIKSNSSRWAHDQGHKFAWQENYAAFRVSASLVPTVLRDIQNQEAHHRKMRFDARFVILLKKFVLG